MGIYLTLRRKKYGIPHGVYYTTDDMMCDSYLFLSHYRLARQGFQNRTEEEKYAEDFAKKCPKCEGQVVEEILKYKERGWFLKWIHKADNIYLFRTHGEYKIELRKQHVYHGYLRPSYDLYTMICPICKTKYSVIFNLNQFKRDYQYPYEKRGYFKKEYKSND